MVRQASTRPRTRFFAPSSNLAIDAPSRASGSPALAGRDFERIPASTVNTVPELPEVEVVRRQLATVLCGRRIDSVWTAKRSYFFITPPRALARRLVGRRVDSLDRRGKYIVVDLDDASRLLCHLGMTGQITARPLRRDPHVHMQLHLEGGGCITFRDVRKFGKVEWLPAEGASARLDRLGPDALTVRASTLAERLRQRRIPVKNALLNQSVLAGVGNIYADEALFAARIHPIRKAHELTEEEIARLARQIRRILKTAVRKGGSTINDYIQPDGELGGYQNWHAVYGKTGQPCSGCGTLIERMILTARSTHYCRHCQT